MYVMFFRKMSIEIFIQVYLEYPSIFSQIPELKFLIKRFQIYSLVIRDSESREKAKEFYNSNFRFIINLKEFSYINDYFTALFENRNSRNILIDYFYYMREEFFDKLELLFLQSLENNNCMIFEKDYNSKSIEYCFPFELQKFELLPLEDDLFYQVILEQKINKENNSLILFDKAVGEFQTTEESIFNVVKTIENSNNENNDTYDISNKTNNNSNDDNEAKINNLITKFYLPIKNIKSNYKTYLKTKININTNISNEYINNEKYQVKNLNEILGISIQEAFKYKQNDCCKVHFSILVIGTKTNTIQRLNSINNFTYNTLISSSQVIPEESCFLNKYFNYREHNYFLKNFSPKFIKREGVDKLIIRRFRKYTLNYLKGKGIVYSNKTNKDDVVALYSNTNLFFIMNFSYNNYIPPFQYKNLSFKSHNTNYLVWLFKDKLVNYVYESFSNDEGLDFYNKLLKDYDLVNKESSITEKLKYYIVNYNKIYNKIYNLNDYLLAKEKYDLRKLAISTDDYSKEVEKSNNNNILSNTNNNYSDYKINENNKNKTIIHSSSLEGYINNDKNNYYNNNQLSRCVDEEVSYNMNGFNNYSDLCSNLFENVLHSGSDNDS